MNNDGDISGKTIRGLQVQKPIGQGKFSIVYKAVNQADNSLVALKMIRVTQT
jgi:serine/threonine protein kinase